jgi:hypothetical protein
MWKLDIVKGQHGGAGETGERRFDGGWLEAAEGEIREIGPEAAPAAGEQAGLHGDTKGA